MVPNPSRYTGTSARLTSEVSTATTCPSCDRGAASVRLSGNHSQLSVASTASVPSIQARPARFPIKPRKVSINFSTIAGGQLPAAAEGIEQLYERLEVREPDLNQRILGTEERALRIQHRQHVDRAGVQLDLRDLVGAPCFGDCILLAPILLCGLLGGHQGILDVTEGRNHRLVIVRQQFRVPGLVQAVTADERSALENVLGH